MVPVAGYLASGAKGLKNADKLRDIRRIVETLIKACKKVSSFVAGTRVLIENRSTRPIEEVSVGAPVLSTDRVSGTTVGKAVTATITTAGTKALVDIVVDADGSSGDQTATITATDNHPMWVPRLGGWTPAGSLSAGQRLRDPDGHDVLVEAVSRRTEVTQVYNLSVADFQTYYVAAGDTAGWSTMRRPARAGSPRQRTHRYSRARPCGPTPTRRFVSTPRIPIPARPARPSSTCSSWATAPTRPSITTMAATGPG